MKVLCKSDHPSEKQLNDLNDTFYGNQVLPITPGKQYLVLGMQSTLGNLWIELQGDTGNLISVPLCLFEIMDGRVSRHWIFKRWKDYDFTLWPESFYQEYYHDDLLEGVPNVVSDFRRLLNLLNAEYSN